jgi:hypothetical protein
MPKKNAAHSRSKSRTQQKHIQVVRPAAVKAPPEVSESQEAEAAVETTEESEQPTTVVEQEEPTASNGTAAIAGIRSQTASRRARARMGRAAIVDNAVAPKEAVQEEVAEPVDVEEKENSNGNGALPKGSAAARLAERRRTAQQKKSGVALITPEHYAYVRRDLMIILILAIIMFSVIIILHFVPGIGY